MQEGSFPEKEIRSAGVFRPVGREKENMRPFPGADAVSGNDSLPDNGCIRSEPARRERKNRYGTEAGRLPLSGKD